MPDNRLSYIPVWIYLLAAALYLFVAYKSSGYNNADEHYQIVEFAQYKLGNSKSSDLAWEFQERVRPGIQPLLCYAIFKVARIFGITDPYTLAFILRAITALLAVLVIGYFASSCKHLIKPGNKTGYLLLSFFLWFLPYINVRFSSETWSGILFLAALSLVVDVDKFKSSSVKILLLGIGLGVATLFRYQTGILVAGLMAWLIFVAKINFKQVTIISLSFFAVLGVGVLIDKWLYGEYCLSLYNYFYVNIVKDVASQYGVSPWYEILLYIIKSPGVFGVFIFASYAALLFTNYKNALIWVTLPFLVIHAVIAHKELRFLYPIANLVPLVLILGWQKLQGYPKIIRHKYVLIALWFILAIYDIAGIIAVGFKGAGLTRISVTAYIRKNYKTQKVNVLYVGGCNPFNDWAFPKNTFYNGEGIKLTEILTVWQADLQKHVKPGYGNLLIISNNEITGPRTTELFRKLHLQKKFQSIPDIVQYVNKAYDPDINNTSLMVYEFE